MIKKFQNHVPVLKQRFFCCLFVVLGNQTLERCYTHQERTSPSEPKPWRLSILLNISSNYFGLCLMKLSVNDWVLSNQVYGFHRTSFIRLIQPQLVSNMGSLWFLCSSPFYFLCLFLSFLPLLPSPSSLHFLGIKPWALSPLSQLQERSMEKQACSLSSPQLPALTEAPFTHPLAPPTTD